MKLKLCVKRSRTASSSGTSNPHQASSSSSANVVANNDDLLIEILLRLPIRPLLKFKCISKHWLSLISNPHFSRRRCPTPNPVSGLFLRTSSSFIPNTEFDFLPLDDIDVKPAPRSPFTSLTFGNNHDHSGTTILQSCNGLLLCCSFDENHFESYYYVYNPTTKHFTTLPRLPLSDDIEFRSSFGLALAFDPSRSPHYKVICVQRYNSSMDQYRIQIYSSDTGPWRLSGNSFFSAPCESDVYFGDGVYWNGAIHWIGPSLCFHIDQEQVKKMPLPPRLGIIDNEETRVRYFGESCDHLHLIESYGPLHRQLHIYEMETDYSRWYVKYCVDLHHVIEEFPEMIRSYRDPFDFHYYALAVLCFVERENDHDSFLVLHVPGKATRYNLHCKSFRRICDFSPRYAHDSGSDSGHHYLQFSWRDAFQFIESITCV